MHSNHNTGAFSENEEYFSNTTADGIVYFWNVPGGQLKNEYKPSSHLSATCSCISWGPSKRKAVLTPKKKKRKPIEEDVSDLQLVALGTESGTVLLYSLLREELHKKLEGHTARVNGISWSEGENFFTCSSDKHIIEWNSSTCSMNSKWKADDNEIYSICYMNNSMLLSASSVIKLWNVENKSLIRRFTGHASEVWKLLPIFSSDTELQNSGYFLSAALGERVINAWQTKSSTRDRKALASYTLTDEPVFIDVSKPSSKEEPVLLSAVTRNGDMLVFEHLLNGRKHSPLKPKFTVKIATNSKHSNFMPIIAVRNCNDSERSLLIVYGSVLRPRFEKISVSSCDETVILVRDNHLVETKSVVKTEQKSLKVTEPKISKDARSLGPAQMNPVKPLLESSMTSPQKASNDTNSELSLSLNERLKAIEPETVVNGEETVLETPRADSLVHLLVQGLQSKDRRMLDTVLQRSDVNLIKNTIKKLPIEYLSSLLNELQHHLYYKGDANLVYLTWLEILLQTKLSLILTLPNIDSQLMPLLELLNIRCDIFDRVYKLQGRLNLMLSQITTETHEDATKKEPLLKYQDSSSEDESDKEDDEDDDNQIEGLMEVNESDEDTDEDTEKDEEEMETDAETTDSENEETE